MKTGNLDERFGAPGATALPWDDVERMLTEAELYWLTTVRADGRPHVAPLVGVAWVAKYGEDWAWEADDDGFTAGDGSNPWVYVVPPAKVIAFGKDPHSQTTYRP